MYLGALFLLIGTPLALGSWWTLLLFDVFLTILVARILNEEKVVARGLPDYVEYTHKVRYRLIIQAFGKRGAGKTTALGSAI